MIDDYKQDFNFEYFECSAKNGQNVEFAINILLRKILAGKIKL